MSVLLLLLMAYELVGSAAHEWIWVGMLALFLVHHALNGKWTRNLFRGKVTPLRALQTALAALALVTMLGSFVSALLVSRTVFAFLPVRGGRSLGRMLHMLSAYWGFVFLSLHLGLHWGTMLALAGRLCKGPSRARRILLRALGGAIALYGAWAFFRRSIPDYLFLRTQFAFFDFSEPRIFFFLDYVAAMGDLCLDRTLPGKGRAASEGGKKRMKRAPCALLLTLCACAAPEPEEAQASFFAMNTYMTMTAHGADAQAAVDRAQARIEALESLWSVTQEGSDIYAVNHAQGQPVAVHEETAALLSFALDMAEETGGALEPTLYPVLAAWGFTADAHRVPEEAELAALLENVDYARVRVQGGDRAAGPGHDAGPGRRG